MFPSNKLNALFFRLENFQQEISDKPGKEVINLRAEVKILKKTTNGEYWFFENINKRGKHLERLMKNQEKRYK